MNILKNASSENSQISNGDVEQAYINNPDGQFTLRDSGSTLDFSKMMQVDANNKVEKEICRRPVFVSESEAAERKSRIAKK